MALEGKNAKSCAKKRTFFAAKENTLFATRLRNDNLRIKRAKENATPTHNAITTTAYSVSFPV